ILRYLKADGRIHLVVFNNIQVADGKRHKMILRLSSFHRGSSSVELYLDCNQVDTIQDLPRAFSRLFHSSEPVELRTFQRKAQDTLEELKLVVRGSLFQVASLQECFLQQSDHVPSSSSAGDINWQVLGQMTQLNKILGEVKDLLRQQVEYKPLSMTHSQ
ncbi:thrombospondin-4-like, partial [Vombatus ursinus]|uniref:thrombospondin-4-like n=1 Tax=Vombatus ursinus TaxID=29139 RepID=UPI000FFD8D1E